jgi:hypothetical protein
MQAIVCGTYRARPPCELKFTPDPPTWLCLKKFYLEYEIILVSVPLCGTNFVCSCHKFLFRSVFISSVLSSSSIKLESRQTPISSVSTCVFFTALLVKTYAEKEGLRGEIGFHPDIGG